MHHYLLDSRAAKVTSGAQLAKIQAWIKASHIAGQQYDLKSPQQIVEQVQKTAAMHTKPTIVVIGDDFSLDTAITALLDDQRDIALGYIPLKNETPSSTLLGYTNWKQACDALLKAKRAAMPLLRVEDFTILSECELQPIQSDTDAPSSAINSVVRLDARLELSVPRASWRITNLQHDADRQMQPKAFCIEARILSIAERHKKEARQRLDLATKIIAPSHQSILKLKANSAKLSLEAPLLLQGIVQLRNDIKIEKLTKTQQFIVQAKSSALA